MTRIHVNLFAVRVFERLTSMKDFVDHLDKSLPLIKANEREELDQVATDHTWDSEEHAMERQIIDERFDVWLPRTAAYSTLILLQSAVETQLFACAERVGRQSACPIRPRDMLTGRAPTTAVAAKYLAKVANVKVASYPSWPRLQDLSKLRNIVAHRGGTRGTAPEHQVEFDDLIKRHTPRLALRDDRIWVSLAFCRQMIDDVSSFFAQALVDVGVAKEALPREYR